MFSLNKAPYPSTWFISWWRRLRELMVVSSGSSSSLFQRRRGKIHEPLRRAHEYYARRALREPVSLEVVERWLKRINEGM
jgi:hypothetical protein